MAITTVALAQCRSHWDVSINIETLENAVEAAVGGGAAMMFLPEMAGLLDRDRARAAASVTTEDDSPYVMAARRLAARHRLWLHPGSLPVIGEDGRWRNRSLVIDPSGDIVARYDKIHLFDIDLPSGESWRESAAYAPGDDVVMVEYTPVGTLGLATCYDVRFPELFLRLRAGGADVIALPSAFTVPTGQDHWHVLVRARALDSGCHILAPAQSGAHADGRDTYGHSLAVDPWGRVLADLGGDLTVTMVHIDADVRTDVRRRLPLESHRRGNL